MHVQPVDGKRIELVPFTATEVPLYFQWMQDPYILEMTETEEGLTLEQVAKMQQDWWKDSDKFIFLIKAKSEETKHEGSGMTDSCEEGDRPLVVGDIGLFYQSGGEDLSRGEFSLMIAESWARRRGYATEAIQLVMEYAKANFGTTSFFAKLRDTNVASARMFEKLDFEKAGYSTAFKEFTFEKQLQ